MPCSLNSYYVENYITLFDPTIIEKTHNTRLSAKEIDIYAWQLEIAKTDDELNSLPIGIENTGNFKYKFEKVDDQIYLLILKMF